MAENGLALHEILLSIADSVNEAQMQLKNMPPYDAFGRPNAIYQLPYLDFTLEVISEVETATENPASGSSPKVIDTKVSKKIGVASLQKLRFSMPTNNTQKSTTASNKITSTISGRFVAVLPNEGLPQIIISATAIKKSNLVYDIVVHLTFATGERVAGKNVEINFDEQGSLELNNNIPLKAAPKFNSSKEGVTDNMGDFKTNVTIDNEDRIKTIVFIANSASIFTSVAL